MSSASNKCYLPPNVTTPVDCGSDRKYKLQNSADSNDKNTTLPRKNPVIWPTALHVDAYPTFFLNEKNRLILLIRIVQP